MLSSGLREVMKALLIPLAHRPEGAQWQPLVAQGRACAGPCRQALRFHLPLYRRAADHRRCLRARPPGGQCQNHGIVLLDQAEWHGEKTLAVPVGGAIHSVKSVHISLLHELSRTHGCNRLITL